MLRNSGPGRLTEVHADVHAVGSVGRLEGHDASAHHQEIVLVFGVAEILHRRDVSLRQDQDVTRTVGKGVQDNEAEVALGDDARALIDRLFGQRTKDARAVGGVGLGDVGHVVLAPRGREPLQGHYRSSGEPCVAISSSTRSRNAATLTPRSGSFDPRALTPRVPFSTSSSPTTRMYGIFSSLAFRIRAPSGSLASPTLTRMPSRAIVSAT